MSALVTIISGTCDRCKEICEGCEVQRCEAGRHDCPFCGAMIARCFDSEDDMLDEALS